jgi:hypothetical protein
MLDSEHTASIRRKIIGEIMSRSFAAHFSTVLAAVALTIAVGAGVFAGHPVGCRADSGGATTPAPDGHGWID